MSKSVLAIFITGCAVMISKSSSSILPYREISTNDNEPNCLESTATFCVDVASYPDDEIKKVLTPDYEKYFLRYPIEVSDRNQEDIESDNMCATKSDYLKPKIGITANNITMLIINLGINYMQEIRVENCVETAACKNIKNMENCYCKQKYTYQPLFAVDVNISKPIVMLFKTPSGCCAAKTSLRK